MKFREYNEPPQVLFFKYVHICVAGLTEVTTGQLLSLPQMVGEPQPQPGLEKRRCIHSLAPTSCHSTFADWPVHSSSLGVMIMCVRVFWRERTLNPRLVPCGLSGGRMCDSRSSSCSPFSSQIFANRCAEPARRFFDQSSFNKSSWLDANVTFCMWKDEATEGLVLIRPKLINGRFKHPPCYCGETPEVQGFKSRLISTLLLLFLLQTNE